MAPLSYDGKKAKFGYNRSVPFDIYQEADKAFRRHFD